MTDEIDILPIKSGKVSDDLPNQPALTEAERKERQAREQRFRNGPRVDEKARAMTDDELVDYVAKALEDQSGEPTDADEKAGIAFAVRYAKRPIRQQMLEEMREPSEAMISAGQGWGVMAPESLIGRWQAMLDAFTAQQEGKGDE